MKWAWRGILIAAALSAAAVVWWSWREPPERKVARLLEDLDNLPRCRPTPYDFDFRESRWNRFRAAWNTLGPEAVPALIDALGKRRYQCRYLVARKLGEIGDPRAVQPLIDTLTDRDFIVRQDAIYALAVQRYEGLTNSR
jgi:hypothetical protein